LAAAHPFEDLERQPHSARRQVHGKPTVVGEVAAAENRSGGGMIQRRRVHEARVRAVTNQRHRFVPVDIRRNVGRQFDGREHLVLRAEWFHPADAPEKQPGQSSAPDRMR
jgi:hypothetical protein